MHFPFPHYAARRATSGCCRPWREIRPKLWTVQATGVTLLHKKSGQSPNNWSRAETVIVATPIADSQETEILLLVVAKCCFFTANLFLSPGGRNRKVVFLNCVGGVEMYHDKEF